MIYNADLRFHGIETGTRGSHNDPRLTVSGVRERRINFYDFRSFYAGGHTTVENHRRNTQPITSMLHQLRRRNHRYVTLMLLPLENLTTKLLDLPLSPANTSLLPRQIQGEINFTNCEYNILRLARLFAKPYAALYRASLLKKKKKNYARHSYNNFILKKRVINLLDWSRGSCVFFPP